MSMSRVLTLLVKVCGLHRCLFVYGIVLQDLTEQSCFNVAATQDHDHGLASQFGTELSGPCQGSRARSLSNICVVR